MKTITEHKPGHFSWVDLMSVEIDSAAEFYSKLFGWKAERQATEGHPYTMFFLDELGVGGLGQMSDEMKNGEVPPCWNTYVTVDNVEQMVEKATSFGATVMMPPMDVMKSGRMAIVVDTVGAAISLSQPIEHAGCQVKNRPGSFCWNELITPEPEKARQF